MDESERAEQYQYFRHEATKASRWFYVSSAAFAICLTVAAASGVNEGWPWLIVGIGGLGILIWSLIDLRYFDQRIAIHLMQSEIHQGLASWNARAND